MAESQRSQRLTRFGFALALLALLGPAVFVAANGVVASTIGSIAIGIVVVLLLLGSMWRWLQTRVEGRGAAAAFVVWLMACGVAASQLSGVAVFMGDVSRSDRAFYKPQRTLDDFSLNGSLIPGHYCATAYVVACQLATERAGNLYDSSLYDSAGEEQKTIVHEQIGETFGIDDYHYPPPFLLLPKLLMVVGGGTHSFRSLLFGLEVVALVLVLGAFARWISPDRFGVAWFALPALLLAPDMLTTLQIGNIHFLIVCVAMGGMLAIEERRHTLGGLLLAFSIVGKLFPLVLLVYLAARRSWRAVAFTGGFVALYSLLTFMVFGWAPFEAFWSYQLPRLASGEAFSGLLQVPIVKVLNVSIAGIPPKLGLLGLTDWDSDTLALFITVAFSVFLLIALIAAGLRHHRLYGSNEDASRSGSARAIVAASWLALLVLAQLRSPLLPSVYGNLSTLWLVCILAAGVKRRSPLWFLPLGLIFATPLTLPFGPPTITLDLIFTLVTLGITLALAAWLAFRSPPDDARAVVE